jgi:hypothetical protein
MRQHQGDLALRQFVAAGTSLTRVQNQHGLMCFEEVTGVVECPFIGDDTIWEPRPPGEGRGDGGESASRIPR